jgi:3-oxoacyl-[acyl-carrier-protein] synthase-1
MARGLNILSVGMVTPVGLTAPATAAATRAGISRVRETPLVDLRFRPHLGAFVDSSYLPELPMAAGGLSFRERRMLQLAALALREAARPLTEPPVLLLAVPEELNAGDRASARFLEALSKSAGVPLDLRQSRCFPQGRAAGMLALAEAFQRLESRRTSDLLVGGVDTLLAPELLASFELEERLRGAGPTDGFLPGEGAGFLWLEAAASGRRARPPPLASIEGVGTGQEPGHRYSQEPYRGEGLAEAFHALFAPRPASAPRVKSVYAGLNGESFWAKEWGVAYLRSQARFAEDMTLLHPVENFGDPGAALGPLMLGLAALGLQRRYRQGPCLVWCSSDRAERGAALLCAQEGTLHGDG